MKQLVVLMMSLALFGAACSNGDGGITVAGDDGSSDTDSSEASSDSESGGGDSDSGDWCVDALSFDEATDVLDSAEIPTADELRAALESVEGRLDEIAASAPNAIKDDVETSFEGMRLLFDALADADYDFLSMDLAALDEIDDPKYEEAAENIEAYLEDVCGRAPDEPSDSGDDTSADDGAGDDTGFLDDDSGNVDLPTDGTVRDAIVEGLVASGFSESEASCLAETLSAEILANADDPSVMFDAFDTCGIDLARLGELGG
jgi:hypothetical protein